MTNRKLSCLYVSLSQLIHQRFVKKISLFNIRLSKTKKKKEANLSKGTAVECFFVLFLLLDGCYEYDTANVALYNHVFTCIYIIMIRICLQWVTITPKYVHIPLKYPLALIARQEKWPNWPQLKRNKGKQTCKITSLYFVVVLFRLLWLFWLWVLLYSYIWWMPHFGWSCILLVLYTCTS